MFIWQKILDFSDLISQITLTPLNNDFKNQLKITDLYYIPYKYIELLNDVILKLKIFSHVNYLNAYNNENIRNVISLKYLKMLNANGVCSITDNL